MLFWKQKHSVCEECGVHFEPTQEGSYEHRWKHLCKIHRKPVMERDLTIDALHHWVGENTERLFTQMQKEQEELRKAELEAYAGLHDHLRGTFGMGNSLGAQQNINPFNRGWL